MGYYINTDSRGNLLAGDRRKQLIAAKDAVPCSPMAFKTLSDIPESLALLCVKQNFAFQAVALIYSQGELEAFRNDPEDLRDTFWLLMDRPLAWRLAGYQPEAP